MKQLLTIISIVILFGAQAQNDTISILHKYDAEKGMMLKWIPRSDAGFIAGNENGYNIFRAEVQKTADGGEKLGVFEKLNSETLKMWADSKWELEVTKDSTLSIAGLFIKGAKEFLDRPVPKTVKEAYDQNQGNEFYHLLGSFSVLSNNGIANALGMFFTDKTVQEGQKYMYKVAVNGTDAYDSYLLIHSVKKKTTKKVLNLQLSLEPSFIRVSWFNDMNKDYPYFNIYRSTKKNGKFERLNNRPFVGAIGEANFTDKTTFYRDSILEYNKTYYYKIVGVDAFVEEGTPSDIVEIDAKYLLQHQPMIAKMNTLDDTDIEINWTFNKEERVYLEGFNVFRAPSGNGPFVRVNEKTISSNGTTFIDKSDKGSSNYYVISAKGSAGDSAQSIVASHLLLDSIPPVEPIGLIGKCDTSGIVTLSWTANTEEDLRGYRIFKTYRKDLDPDRVFPLDTNVTEITDTIDLKMPYNSIYYRVHALDNHFNASIPTDYFEVKIPDNKKPSNGYLKDYSVGMDGISVEWENSTAYDLEKMHLLRKADTDFDFKRILTMSGDSLLITKYKDTNTVSFTNYEYLVVAEDESGLMSERSKAYKIKQLDKRKVIGITDLKAFVSKENRMVKLTWTFPSTAEGFRIYRGRNGESLRTHKFVDGKEREYYDKELKPNSEYIYLIVGELRGGYKSGYSKKVEVTY